MSSHDYQHIEFDLSEQIATITLNRPDHGNALHLPMGNEVFNALSACQYDDTVRAIIITGNGKMFSAGGDLNSMKDAGDQLDSTLSSLVNVVNMCTSTLLRMQKPVICAINGTAAGVGLTLSVCGDYTIASSAAKFTLAYTAAGLTPDGGATWLLPRMIGSKRTAELMMLNRVLSAEEALDWGMVTQVTDEDSLMDEARKVAGKFVHSALPAIGSVKQLLLSSYSESFESQLMYERESIIRNATSPTGQEGISAFLEKRRAKFTDL